MSWLSDFTSKAENLLTKFDQTAAQTLNETGLQRSETSPSPPPLSQANTNAFHNTPTKNTTGPYKDYQNASHLFSTPSTSSIKTEFSASK